MKRIFLLYTFTLASMIGFAQIPNAGFEAWTNVGSYTTPDHWDNFNMVTSPLWISTCMKGTPGNPGGAYLKLVSATVVAAGVVPGFAVSGVIDPATQLPKSGFAFTQRPAQFTGSWQYMAYGSDQGFVTAALTKWNNTTHMRDTVATTYQNLIGMQMTWATFTLNFNYVSNAYPDSAIIVLSASNLTANVANSYLYIDDLAFAGSVPPTAVANITHTDFNASIYPNPATVSADISISSAVAANMDIKITDLSGKTHKEIKRSTLIGNNIVHLDTHNMPKGFYLVNISDGINTRLQKLVIE